MLASTSMRPTAFPLVLRALLPALTLSQELKPTIAIRPFCDPKPSCVGLFCRPCSGSCKVRCGLNESIGVGYCGKGCQCCEPKQNACCGRCKTPLGSGNCKSQCTRREDKIGSCLGGGDCSCCRPKIISDCSGRCKTPLGSGYCKSNCACGEDKIGSCPGGGDCSCCRPTIINNCMGKCETSSGSGYCRKICGRGEERIGNCPGGNCSCCKPRVTPLCGGLCSLGKERGYCSNNVDCDRKPVEELEAEHRVSIIPLPTSCNKGCTCCPFKLDQLEPDQ